MKRLPFLVLFAAFSVCGIFCGCQTERLPVEDLEVKELCEREIAILHNPYIKPNSEEKYRAIKAMMKKVDFSYMRQSDTIYYLLYEGDAVVEKREGNIRVYHFNYQYDNHYVRLSFNIYRGIVLRTTIIEK